MKFAYNLTLDWGHQCFQWWLKGQRANAANANDLFHSKVWMCCRDLVTQLRTRPITRPRHYCSLQTDRYRSSIIHPHFFFHQSASICTTFLYLSPTVTTAAAVLWRSVWTSATAQSCQLRRKSTGKAIPNIACSAGHLWKPILWDSEGIDLDTGTMAPVKLDVQTDHTGVFGPH